MVAAYLCICQEVKHEAKYASAEMVIQMSDNCIRDYLDQMHEIFVVSELPLAEFIEKRIPSNLQDVALKQASKKKREYVPASGVAAPLETLRLVEALGQLTTRIQTSLHDNRALRSSERGIFVLRVGPEGSGDPVAKLITQASEAGFLRVLEQGTSQWKFRVHTSLAAAFGFSYRGAYYDTPIRATDLVALASVLFLKFVYVCGLCGGWC